MQKLKANPARCKNQSMYIRFIARYFNKQTEREETGIFRAADYIRDFSEIDAAEKERLQKIIEWFDENLPVPEFYDDPAQRTEEQHTYFWFKINADEFLERMNLLNEMLEKYQVKVEKLSAENVPGELIFEDYCQIAVIPFENILSVK